ncbi:MAG: protein kinase [Kofleriaceae bacterium]|nr:protein kinase [Kofleriaceae bacterium]
MIGTILDGRYRILRHIGSGGMGEVYLGEHLLMGRKEAIKILKSRFARDEGHLARFRREARATNRLQHNNIVSFYDFGKMPDGRLYLTMEFANGPDLKDVLQAEQKLSVSRAVGVMRQLAAAIDYAHSKGVIHRDLKPENLVLIQGDGQPDMLKVLDFGVAKITEPGYLESIAITREGQVFGTPSYIAPEQIRGSVEDHRSDIYAMGCIAYELLTGAPPFVGRAMQILEAHIGEIPRPPSVILGDDTISAQLDRIVLRCLEKDPELRYQSGGEVAAAMASLQESPKIRIFGQDANETSISGFEAAATIRGEIVLESEDARTTDVFMSRYDLQLRHVLYKLAENLCDQGCSDAFLLVLLAEANQVEQELGGLSRDLADLSRSDRALEQETRERSASLRFALGELNFGREADNEDTAPLSQAVNTLSTRLENLGETSRVKHNVIMEHQINKTAERATKYEELRDIDARLAERIDVNLAQTTVNDTITELQEERERLLMMLEIEGQSD